MRHVGDVHLETPAAVCAAFHVDSVIEIARGFAIDGDNREVAKIFTALAIGLLDGQRAVPGFFFHLRRKLMRQVMLANDDFGIHTELAGAAENFKYPTRRGSTGTRIAKQLDVHDCAVQFRHAWNALRTRAVLLRVLKLPFFPKRWCQLFARRNFDFVLDANVVRQDDIPSRAIAKQTHHGGMRAAENSDDAAFGSLRSREASDAAELHKDLVTVHGVSDGIARNKNVAVKLRHRLFRHDEAVAIMVEDEAALDFVATGGFRDMSCRFWIVSRRAIKRLLFGLAVGEPIPAARKFLNGPALFQFREHFEQLAAVALLQVETAGDFVRGGGCASNVKKMQ